MSNLEEHILKNANTYAELGVRRGQNLQANLLREIIISMLHGAKRCITRVVLLVRSYNSVAGETRT